MELPICMTKEYWMGTQLSVARFSGGFTSGGKHWMMIPQSIDMVRTDFVKYYMKLGRDRFLNVLKEHPHSTDKELISIYKELMKPKKEVEPKDLFEYEQQDYACV